MNNLLRTLTSSQVKAESDLKLLLTSVKEGRRQSYDSKLSDPFYESLEGLLHDLRTVTMDNRDAEAFLRPVSKTEVPDYYDVISNPMDLQSMLKKVKQKVYKSKREFKDDLDLIWSNCFTYNATENHPLRQCAKRLKLKAEKLLKNITDRKERTDPPIPDMPHSRFRTSLGQPNGKTVNGHSRSHAPSLPLKPQKSVTPTVSAAPTPKKDVKKTDVKFSDTPAITRTPEGMVDFWKLDQDMGLDNEVQEHVVERLRDFVLESDEMDEDDTAEDVSGFDTIDGGVGEKRKLNGVLEIHRTHKRARITSQLSEENDSLSLWWNAVLSEPLLANGLPPPRHSPSSQPVLSTPSVAILSKPSLKRKRRPKKLKPQSADQQATMLNLMNNNIRTMKRVRRTHAKFAALNQQDDEDVIEGNDAGDDVRESVDERPWLVPGGSGGIEVGEERAGECLNWMSGKVLEHAGFQGTSKVALDVLAGVASEYLLNVGRTMRFLCDTYGQKMSPEEIILHTLFESGTSKIQDLERYITDDVVRYGARLGDLEKKLVGAYREATAVEALDDDALFGNEDEEEDSAFVMGGFADSFGEDFLGLRELGIASEFGLSSLSIPKKLLKSKNKGRGELDATAAKPSEPPPPFPPPPPFIPLTAAAIDNQIGLLKSYYQGRLSALSTSGQPPPVEVSNAPPPTSGTPSIVPTTAFAPPPFNIPPSASLPDDAPNPSQVKMGPIGQILKVAPSANATKKKNKPKESEKKQPPQLQQKSGNSKKKVKIGESLPPVVFANV